MIKFDEVSFSFGSKIIFDRFSLDIPDGITVLQGPSGCGKTTLLRLAAGLLKPSSGKISGVPKRVALMFQEDRLLPWLSAKKNVAAVLPKSRIDDAAQYIEAVELLYEENTSPDRLSGGQRRRVALARALAYEADLILLDEPFKGLDPSLTERMAKLVISSGAQILMTSHSYFEAELMGGRIINL